MRPLQDHTRADRRSDDDYAVCVLTRAASEPLVPEQGRRDGVRHRRIFVFLRVIHRRETLGPEGAGRRDITFARRGDGPVVAGARRALDMQALRRKIDGDGGRAGRRQRPEQADQTAGKRRRTPYLPHGSPADSAAPAATRQMTLIHLPRGKAGVNARLLCRSICPTCAPSLPHVLGGQPGKGVGANPAPTSA